MSADPRPNPQNQSRLPPGIKVRFHKFGSNATSPMFPLPVDVNTGGTSVPRAPFEAHWENPKIGLNVHFREREDGRVIAEVYCTYPELQDGSAASVGLGGVVADEIQKIHRTIRLTVQDANGRSGSADFGTLSEIVKTIGPKAGIVLFLMI
jgi:hypothetical protein